MELNSGLRTWGGERAQIMLALFLPARSDAHIRRVVPRHLVHQRFLQAISGDWLSFPDPLNQQAKKFADFLG